ncbi:hypothetical protein RND81_09G222000 [Saponaria officinalis]|uniref:MSP domain-containing protein n=1 Tax=Saponaria officinalis TaxID=3572 RepID=A0AAW1IR45_SAPOF
MSHQLEIQPRELRFVVELNKQSKSSITLVNKTDQYVAFKVKTTSPKKYCVRPNVGVVLPNGTYEFVVIMQAPKEVPADLTCKDKFLIQNTIVPEGTGDENITSEMFSRENGRYIEERKLRVILTTPPPPRAHELSPINGTEKQAGDHVELKTVSSEELKSAKDSEVAPISNVKLEPTKNVRFEASNTDDPNALKKVESELVKDIEPTKRKITEVKVAESRVPVGEEEQRLFKEVEEMKFKLHELESKLNKTEATISKVTEERRLAVQDRESLQQEMVILRKRKVERRVQDGFPLLFVCMVALISLVVGYGFHP